MLFNSYEFAFVFLPLTIIIWLVASKKDSYLLSIYLLVAASLLFYAIDNPLFLLLISFSVLFNFKAADFILKTQSRLALGTAISVNLMLLGYWKYADFFISTLNAAGSFDIGLVHVSLPLAISFFTFQQIAYLVDCRRAGFKNYRFAEYAFFICFFPQLIAGPIVHHREMIPQIGNILSPKLKNVAIGLTFFLIGLGKKVLIADNLSLVSDPVFEKALVGEPISLLTGWIALFCYSFQIYFDFSAYSDMAIGLARAFGIVLPINFASPYKADSITDFWRRWHITLSRFFRDYVYIPLGGNRRSPIGQGLTLFATMSLTGLWHGANWTFVIWGILHFVFLLVHRLWSRMPTAPRLPGPIAWLLTFLMVTLAWVPFRAETLEAATFFYQALLGYHGLILPRPLAPIVDLIGSWADTLNVSAGGLGVNPFVTYLLLPLTFAIALLAPNTQMLLREFNPGLRSRGYPDPLRAGSWLPDGERFIWQPRLGWGIAGGALLAVSIMSMSAVKSFIYFRF